MRYDSHQRDFFSVLPAVLRDRCVFVRFANCKDKPTALCKHAVGTEHAVPASRSREGERRSQSVTPKCKTNVLQNSSK